jgi:ATP-binding cassette subfamily F protein 2
MDVYERLDDISADTAEARAAWILHGLGFTKQMQAKKTKDFSGECDSSVVCVQWCREL